MECPQLGKVAGIFKMKVGVEMLKLDHVVYFTEKLPTEVVEEQISLGWHTVVGGSHEKWGTHNALMYVKNAYIEWLSVEHPKIAETANHQLVDLLLRDISEGEDWGTICFSVDGLDAFNERLKSLGFKTSGVLQAERETLDGNLRKWKMLFVDQELSSKLPLPFFIEWGEKEEERLMGLRNDGTISPDNEQLEITECHFSVNLPKEEVTKWATILSAEVSEENSIKLPNTLLKFMRNESVNRNERLTDVVIEHV